MKNFPGLCILVLIFALGLAGCISQQEQLAQKLGVRLQDYPPESNFPYGYFSKTLQPGMKVNEVHQVMIGYEKVLNCVSGDFRAEIYYYYGKNFEGLFPKTMRFEVFYANNRVKEIRGEDKNSHTIDTYGCAEGLLK